MLAYTELLMEIEVLRERQSADRDRGVSGGRAFGLEIPTETELLPCFL